MVHPYRGETEAAHAAKLKAMTSHYEGSPLNALHPAVNKFKAGAPIPEDDVGFG